jgi:hypothetical protein
MQEPEVRPLRSVDLEQQESAMNTLQKLLTVGAVVAATAAATGGPDWSDASLAGADRVTTIARIVTPSNAIDADILGIYGQRSGPTG